MDNLDLLKFVDHTMLKAVSTWADIQKICEEAIKYETASVCIPPSYVKKVADVYGDAINICTVIGFPLGYSTTATKVFEAKDAIANGASEIDMVINIGELKNGNGQFVKDEIAALKEAVGEKILKVIVETCYLTEEEKVLMCNLVTEAGADYIKTSTGFGTGGATLEDIVLFRNNIGKNVKMKAAGGVKTVEDLRHFIEAGCSRIGTSSGVAIVTGDKDQQKGY